MKTCKANFTSKHTNIEIKTLWEQEWERNKEWEKEWDRIKRIERDREKEKKEITG